MSARAAEIQSSGVFSPEHILLPDISYKAFTYPGDEEALDALKRIPGAPALLTYLQEHFTEQLVFVENNQQMIRAGTHSYRSVYKLVERCAEILCLSVPDVYITQNPVLNAYTVGHRRTCIVLHTSLLDALTADELAFVIGHELGHVKCGHGLYRQLGNLLVQYWDAVSALIPIPGLGLARIPLLIAFWEWYRRAEFTCDRAGLLCGQNPEAALRGLGKLAGRINGLEDEFDIESAITQAQAKKEVNKLVLVVSILNASQNTHPFIPNRLKNAREYSQSDAYQNILRGDYQRDPLGLHEGGIRVKCVCGQKVNAKLNFCPECGRAVETGEPDPESAASVCVSCGHSLAPGTKFCTECGARQDASTIEKVKSSAAGLFKRS